jgi:multidrug resistance efflux pump
MMMNPLKRLAAGSSGRLLTVLLIATIASSAALARHVVEPPANPEPILSEGIVGLLRPIDISSITTPIPVTIAEVVVAPGDELTANQPIARIDRTDGERELARLALEIERATGEVNERERAVAWTEHANQRLVAEVAQATAALALAERETQAVPMRQARDSPERAQVAYERAVMKLRRAEELASTGLVAKQDVQDARFEVRMASDDLANARLAADAATHLHSAEQTQTRARQELSLAEERRQLAVQQAELQRARLGLQETKLRYDTARLAVADAFVRAPRAGAIVELPLHEGDRLSPGALLAKIAPLDPIAVDVDVAPAVVNTLQIGGLARVDVSAVKLFDAEGSIRSIAPLPGDDGKYSVRLTLANPTRARLAGQTAKVKFSIPRPARRP